MVKQSIKPVTINSLARAAAVTLLIGLLLPALSACAKEAREPDEAKPSAVRTEAPEAAPTSPASLPASPSGAVALPAVPAGVFSDGVRLLFVNVGKADACIITDGENNYLVDTGEKSSVPQLFGALQYLGIDSIDGVFLTHTHSDHIGGMKTLAQYYDIGTLYHAEFTELTKKSKNQFEELSKDLSISAQVLKAGESLTPGDGMRIDVLGPLALNSDDDNDNSLVLMLNVGGKKILLTGDMQFAEEATLLERGAPLAADVLKVGNHGNPDATSEAFADAVSPAFAVISTDTAVDADSANPRVKQALSGAEIYVTQDFHLGALFAIGADGEIRISNASAYGEQPALEIVSIDKDAQTVTVSNSGERADLSGYMILSEKGNELFVFPEGFVLDEGESVSIACEGGSGDLIWANEDKAWNLKKPDTGVLYDRFGNELARRIGQ